MTMLLTRHVVAAAAALSLAPGTAWAISLNQLLQDNFLLDDGSGVVEPTNVLTAFECTSESSANVTISFSNPFSGSFTSPVSSEDIIDECASFADDDGDDGDDAGGGDDDEDVADDDEDTGDEDVADDDGADDADDAGDDEDVAEEAPADEVDAEEAATVVDGNLNDIFPELFSGDVLGAFGVPEPPILILFDPEKRKQACADCKDRLAQLRADLEREEAFLADREAALLGLANFDEDVLEAEGVPSLDDLIAQNSQFDELGFLEADQRALVAELSTLRSDFPSLTDKTGNRSRDLKDDAGAMLERAVENVRTSKEIVQIFNEAGEKKARAFANGAVELVGDIAKAITAGSPIDAGKSVLGTFNTTRNLFDTVFIGQAANELEFKLRREFEQIELLRDIESLNRIIAATRQSFEVEAQRQQFELIEERMAVIEAGQPAQERLVERLRQSVADTADLCAKLCPIGSSQNRTPAAFERATSVETSNRITASGNTLAFSFNLDQMRRQQTVGFSQTATGARADEPLVNLPGFLGDRRFNVFAAGDVSFS
ncbi:MAG: hypothetical protein AAF401_05360, partial [Pseudomonadota bacterium]